MRSILWSSFATVLLVAGPAFAGGGSAGDVELGIYGGFDHPDNYGNTNELLSKLMQGAPNWRDLARTLRVRYIFWGREEKTNYASSTRPWEKELKPIATGPWGSIYDLEPSQQAPPAAAAPAAASPTPIAIPVPSTPGQ